MNHDSVNHDSINHDSINHDSVNHGPDHRDLGRAMGVFAGDPMLGSGLPLWLPAGAVIREELEGLARQLALESGCQRVFSPVLGKRALYERSGHWAKFHDDMFPPMDVGGEEFVLRPANCPHHALIYAADQHSYRELPIRYSELAPMFRSEPSGALTGLSRVRQICLDDAHVFARHDQIGEEVLGALRCALRACAILGIEIDHLRLSCRDESANYLGAPEQWKIAEQQLRQAIIDLGPELQGIRCDEALGEAAFYGPKIDLQVRDARGAQETLSTVQLDFVQPERFDLRYVAADGSRQRVVMIHRGIVGSMERMVAFLLERYGGRLPLWLAPVQACVLPVGPAEHEAAAELATALRAAGLRSRLEVPGSLGARIRASRTRRDALMAVVGPREAPSGRVHVTDPDSGFRGVVRREVLVDIMVQAYADRAHRIDWARAAV